MITVYAPDTQDWSNNGLCTLYPTSCPITEVGGGNYDLEINHPMTDDQRWVYLQKSHLIKAPVPKRETPLISNWHEGNEGVPGHVIYETNITTSQTGGYVRIYTKADSASKTLQKLKNHVEFIFHSNIGSNWVKGTSAEGTTGYLYKPNVRYVRTEMEIPSTPGYSTVVPPRQVRDQLFRIYSVTIDTEQHSVKALARHISYDQVRNFIKTYNPKDTQLQAALEAMSADMLNAHDFNYYTNIVSNITADWALKNGVLALLDPEQGAASKTHAQVVRDNYDIFLLENIDTDRGVVIESGKNLLGVVSDVNDDNAVTRIMPYGTDADGKQLLLPEIYIDSQYIGNYPNIRAIPLQVPEAVEKAASGSDPGMTKDQCFEKMRTAVQAQYDAGADLPDIDIKVTFVQLGDTEEYKAYKNLQQLYLYDTVTVKHGRLGLYYKTQVIGYTYDAALKRYTGMTLGNIKNGADLGAVAGFQLPTAGISGMKLVPGTVGSMELRELSVLAAHIGLAQIVNAHIQDATIDKAKIKDFTAEVAAIAVAKIGEAWIDTAWIDKLTAQVVDIVTANIDTLIANSATIDWAHIANLTAAVSDIVVANINTANINWAHINGLVADTALFTQGASGQLYCADLMVTDANIESLSANKIAGGMATFGKLMLMGQDGKLYEINVGSLGEVTATEKQLDGDNVGDYTLTDRNLAEGTLTARTLNVQSIFSDSALVRQLIAQSIDTNTLFANLGYINALRTYLIQSDIGGYLNLQSNTGIKAMVSQYITGIEIGGTNTFSTTSVLSCAAEHYFVHDTTINGLYILNTQTAPFGTFRTTKTITENGQWTVSFYIRGNAVMGSTFYIDVDVCDSNRQAVYLPATPETWKYVSFTFEVNNYSDAVYNFVDFSTSFWGQYWIKDLKVEKGNKATAWSPCPDDSYRKVSGFTIDPDNGMDIYGIKLTVRDIQGADPTFIVDNIQKIVKAINAQFNYLTLNGPLTGTGHNIVTKDATTWITLNPGPNTQATIDALAKCRVNDTGIQFNPGNYDVINFSGFFGPGSIVLYSAEGVVIDTLKITNNACIFYMHTPSASDITKFLQIRTTDNEAAFVILNSVVDVTGGIRLTGRARANADDGTSMCIQVDQHGHLTMRAGITERTRWYGLYVGKGASAYFANVCGGQPGGDYTTLSNIAYGILVHEGGLAYLDQQCPIGNAANVVNWGAHPVAGTYTPTASPGVYTPPVQYNVQYIHNSSKYCDLPDTANMGTASSVWSPSAPRGGRWDSQKQRYAGMWLLQRNGGGVEDIRTLLIGHTPISATLRVHCVDCWAGSAVHDLYFMTVGNLPVGGDAPNSRLVDTGIDITLTQGQDTVIDVTAFIQGRIAAGDDFYGFGLGLASGYVKMDTTCTLDIVYR